MSSELPADLAPEASTIDISDFEMYHDKELELSERQVEAITADSPIRLVAGPGAGKTTTVAFRVEYLIRVRRIPPGRILVMAYNRDAAEQLREDLVNYLGEAGREVTVKTFHGFATHCLINVIGHRTDLGTDFQKIPDYHQSRLLRQAASEAIVGDLWNQLDMDSGEKDSALKSFVRKMKSAGKSPEDIAEYYGVDRSFHFREILAYLECWIDLLDADLGSSCWLFVDTREESEMVGREAITAELSDVLSALDQPQAATSADLPATGDEEQTVVHAIEDLLGQAETVLRELQTVIETSSGQDQIQALAATARLLGGTVRSASGEELPDRFETGLPAMAYADRLRAAKREITLAMALQPAYEEYQSRLEDKGFVDYADIIAAAATAFEKGRGDVVAERYSHVIVDEFQDSTAMQFTIANAIAGESNEITIAGDPCQSIYEWRTAFRENFTRRPERIYGDDLTTVELQANRRSKAGIRHVVNTLLDHARTDLDPVEQADPQDIPVARTLPAREASKTDWGWLSD